jgi:hypothetical protein
MAAADLISLGIGSPAGIRAFVLFGLTGGAAGTAPTVTTESLLGGYVGYPYLGNLAATGDTPITWAVTVGALPDGLSLDANTGAITGTPTTAEVANFTVEATNGFGTDTQALSITILDEAPPSGNKVKRMRRPRGMRLL